MRSEAESDLIRQLAECYRLTGADPDGNEDWRLAQSAVAEVRRLRQEFDEAQAEVEATKIWCAKATASVRHAFQKRMSELRDLANRAGLDSALVALATCGSSATCPLTSWGGKEEAKFYAELEAIAKSAAAKLAAEAPSWMERPSGPGLWVCMPDASLRSPLNGIVTLDLDDEDIARGAPFHTSVVFGPLPKAPAMKGEGDE